MQETIGKFGNFHFFRLPRFDTVRLGEWMTGMIHEPVYRGGKTTKHGVDVSDTAYVFSRMQIFCEKICIRESAEDLQTEKCICMQV